MLQQFEAFLLNGISYLLTGIVRGLFALFSWILHVTVFASYSLTPGANNPVGNAAHAVWANLALISGGVAFAVLAVGIGSRLLFAPVRSKTEWADISEGVLMWGATLFGGYGMLTLFLKVANTATVQFQKIALHGMLQFLKQPNAISLTGQALSVAALFLVDLIWPIVALILAIVFLRVILMWIMRQVDLILFVGILPIMAALSVGGNRRPFQWAWTEALGAVFSQVSMALLLVIASTITVHYYNANPAAAGTRYLNPSIVAVPGFAATAQGAIGTAVHDVMSMVVAAIAFSLVLKGPVWLQEILGHRHAGVSNLAMGVAGGMLLARGAQAAWRMSPLGAATGMMSEGLQQRGQRKVLEGSHGPSAGERFQGTRMGKALAAARTRMADSPIGQSWAGQKGAQAATWMANSGAARGLSRMAQPRRALGQIAQSARVEAFEHTHSQPGRAMHASAIETAFAALPPDQAVKHLKEVHGIELSEVTQHVGMERVMRRNAQGEPLNAEGQVVPEAEADMVFRPKPAAAPTLTTAQRQARTRINELTQLHAAHVPKEHRKYGSY